MPNENFSDAQNERRAAQASALPFARADVALLILLAAFLALFFWRILTPNPLDRAQFPPGDFTDQFYAFRLYTARALAQGHIPLWSENFNGGHPFLADIQSAVFYPIALANTLLNLALFHSFSLFALELEALLHFYLAGAFTYIFARRALRRTHHAARAGAFVSACVFMFGGYLTSYPPLQLAILETAAWLPLALFFLDKATTDDARQTTHENQRRQRVIFQPTWLIAAGMTLGVAALAGHPQTFLFVFATTILYFLFRVWQNNPQSKIENRKSKIYPRAFGTIVLLALVAFGVAAIQLVPAVEYQQLSTREALSFAEAAKGFPTLEILQFILPGYTNAFASPLYVGILPLWLALFALAARRTPNDERRIAAPIFWGIVALGALLLAFGFYVFAYVIFYLFVPGAALFRQQERLAFIVSFALAMLAGYGFADLLGTFDLKRAKKLFLLLPAGAILMLALLLAFFVAGAQNPQPRFAFLGDRAGLLLIQFALASLLVGLYLKNFLNARWFSILALALILFDLWSVNEPANKGRVEERLANIPFLEQLQSDPAIFRVAADDQLLPGHFGIATGLEEIGGISPLRLARYNQLLQLPNAFAWLNVKYVITQTPQKFAGAVIARDDAVVLMRVTPPNAYAWATQTLVLDPDDARAAAQLAAQTPSPIPDSQVVVVARQPERIMLDVTTPQDGYLLVSENYYPGWRATVDGQPAEILRANLTLRALSLRAGKQRVEMWYDPLSFKLGAALSLVTLLACVGALIYFQAANRTHNANNSLAV